MNSEFLIRKRDYACMSFMLAAACEAIAKSLIAEGKYLKPDNLKAYEALLADISGSLVLEGTRRMEATPAAIDMAVEAYQKTKGTGESLIIRIQQ